MVTALGSRTGRKVYRRVYTHNGMRVCVEVVNNRGVIRWFANWYALNRAGHGRFVFGGAGNCETLREAWGQVRRHVRVYMSGLDVLNVERRGKC